MRRSLTTYTLAAVALLMATGAMAGTPSAADDAAKKEEGIGKLAHALAQKIGNTPPCAKRTAETKEEVFQFNLYGETLNCFTRDRKMHPLMTLNELREVNFDIIKVGATRPGRLSTYKLGGLNLLFYTPFLPKPQPETDAVDALMKSPALLVGREINAAYVRALNLVIEAANKKKMAENKNGLNNAKTLEFPN